MNSTVTQRTRQVLSDMKQRCYNKAHPQYKNYGARGIGICARWLESTQDFIDDMGLKPDGLTIDRVDNDGNYEPWNCRWATKTEQRINQRTCRLLTFNGVTKSLRYWAKEYGIHEMTLHHRIVNGWDSAKAITTPVDKRLSEYGKKGCATRHAAIAANKAGVNSGGAS